MVRLSNTLVLTVIICVITTCIKVANGANLWEGRLNITPSPVNVMHVIDMNTHNHTNWSKSVAEFLKVNGALRLIISETGSIVCGCLTGSSSGGINLWTSSRSVLACWWVRAVVVQRRAVPWLPLLWMAWQVLEAERGWFAASLLPPPMGQ
jgi:hypothetical protein